MKITLLGEPKSTQHCYKYRRAGNFIMGYMDAKCKTLKADYKQQTMAQYKGKPLKELVGIKMEVWHGTKRKSDIDNYLKLVFDALSGIVYEDDVQIVELNIKKGYCKNRPRVELDISII